MIHLILFLLGLSWIVGHWAYWIVHIACAAGAVYVLHTKNYVHDARGVVLAIVCVLDWGTGLFVALLLRTAPSPPTPIYTPPYDYERTA